MLVVVHIRDDDLVAGREAFEHFDEIETRDTEPHAAAISAIPARDEDLLVSFAACGRALGYAQRTFAAACHDKDLDPEIGAQ
jgi:hypothetical protein